MLVKPSYLLKNMEMRVAERTNSLYDTIIVLECGKVQLIYDNDEKKGLLNKLCFSHLNNFLWWNKKLETLKKTAKQFSSRFRLSQKVSESLTFIERA